MKGNLTKSQQKRINMRDIKEFSSVSKELMEENGLKWCNINKQSGEWRGK